MRPRKTEHSENVLRLPGGNEDNDLWFYKVPIQGGGEATVSVWVPNEDERRRITEGENIRLIVFSPGHPPVAMDTTDETIKGVDRTKPRRVEIEGVLGYEYHAYENDQIQMNGELLPLDDLLTEIGYHTQTISAEDNPNCRPYTSFGKVRITIERIED